jgi:hypothetical protein
MTEYRLTPFSTADRFFKRRSYEHRAIGREKVP